MKGGGSVPFHAKLDRMVRGEEDWDEEFLIRASTRFPYDDRFLEALDWLRQQ